MGIKSTGERIRKFREKKGLTQNDLADRIYISASALCRWEKGLTEPSVELIYRMCTVFEISVADFFSDKEETE